MRGVAHTTDPDAHRAAHPRCQVNQRPSSTMQRLGFGVAFSSNQKRNCHTHRSMSSISKICGRARPFWRAHRFARTDCHCGSTTRRPVPAMCRRRRLRGRNLGYGHQQAWQQPTQHCHGLSVKNRRGYLQTNSRMMRAKHTFPAQRSAWPGQITEVSLRKTVKACVTTRSLDCSAPQTVSCGRHHCSWQQQHLSQPQVLPGTTAG